MNFFKSPRLSDQLVDRYGAYNKKVLPSSDPYFAQEDQNEDPSPTDERNKLNEQIIRRITQTDDLSIVHSY